MPRTFDERPAVREATPLLIALVSPSGAGKTFSALRLATGIQRVSGGDIHVLDTEARRALHYAPLPGKTPGTGQFRFHHTSFGPPFGPLDYLEAIEYLAKKGAKIIVVDSMSHEHEGPGGILEMHEAEVKRLLGKGFKSEMSASMPAWAKPKQERRRLINSILQMPINFIFCFRAKEKLKIVPGKEPEHLGFMPQAGEEFVYEMLLRCLMLPGANGVPIWSSDYSGEKEIIKLPGQFASLFPDGTQLSEDIGQKLAEWAAGAPAIDRPLGSFTGGPRVNAAEMLSRYAACSDAATLRVLEEERGAGWSGFAAQEKVLLKTASVEATKRVEAAVAPPAREPGDDDAPEPPEDTGPGLDQVPGKPPL